MQHAHLDACRRRLRVATLAQVGGLGEHRPLGGERRAVVGGGVDAGRDFRARGEFVRADADAVFRGADSIVLLTEAARRVRAQGFEIGNIDSTVVAQAPRLAAHIPAMRARISAALELELEQVNVKAKTAERLGPVGQGLAIEARAVVLLLRT